MNNLRRLSNKINTCFFLIFLIVVKTTVCSSVYSKGNCIKLSVFQFKIKRSFKNKIV